MRALIAVSTEELRPDAMGVAGATVQQAGPAAIGGHDDFAFLEFVRHPESETVLPYSVQARFHATQRQVGYLGGGEIRSIAGFRNDPALAGASPI